MTERSITFCSSRMLPGHGYDCRRSRLACRSPNALPGPAGEALDEIAHEQRNVVAAIAQRRHRHRKDVEAIEEIRAKRPGRDRGLEITVGCGNDSHIRFQRPGAAHALELALLQHAQQRALSLRWQLADLVQEDRATFRQFEAPDSPLHRARERALFVTEEL